MSTSLVCPPIPTDESAYDPYATDDHPPTPITVRAASIYRGSSL